HAPFPPGGDFSSGTVDHHRIMLRLGLYAPSTRFFIVFIASTGLKVITQWYDEKRRLKELENSKTEAELSFLKSQIHPHFLFNSLNSIYYLALSKDDKAPEAILSLSNFLRFVTIESDKSFIPLEKELNMLREYLDLQSLRASEKFDLQFDLQGDLNQLNIMPLTFIPFVENAFKYGISAHVDCFIHLNIKIEKEILEFTISNAIMQGEKNIVRSSGIGLDNIRKRLELAYPGHYLLDIKSDDRIFSVYLKINLI
ncbi:MAG: histidine kinase, partial [Dysgonamonadaceae bacterium]|nr:histidine kinase [Dysgonamonadaceae bacterium]